MRRLLTLAASAAFLTTLAFAGTWNGRLVDANCTNQNKMAKECDATGATTAFVLVADGKSYLLDDAGNRKAIEALKSRADRSADPNNPKPAQIGAKVTGDLDGNVLKVETIEVQ